MRRLSALVLLLGMAMSPGPGFADLLSCVANRVAPPEIVPEIEAILLGERVPGPDGSYFQGEAVGPKGRIEIYVGNDELVLISERGQSTKYRALAADDYGVGPGRGAPVNANDFTISESKKWVFLPVHDAEYNTQPMLVSVIDGTSRVIPALKGAEISGFDSGERFLIGLRDETTVVAYDVVRGTVQERGLPADYWAQYVLQGGKIFAYKSGQAPLLLDLATGRMEEVLPQLAGREEMYILAESGSRAAFSASQAKEPGLVFPDGYDSRPRELVIHDFATNETKTSILPSDFYPEASPSKDFAFGFHSVEGSPDRGVILIDLKTGAYKRVWDDPLMHGYWSADGKRLFLVSQDLADGGLLVAIDPVAGKDVGTVRLPAGNDLEYSGSADNGDRAYFKSSVDDADIASVHVLRVDIASGRIARIRMPRNTEVFEVSEDGRMATAHSRYGSFRTPLIHWRDLPGASEARPVPKHDGARAKAYAAVLKRGLDLGRDLPLVNDYLERDGYKTQPELLSPILMSLLERSEMAFQYYLRKHPELGDIALNAPADLSRYSPRQVAGWVAATRRYLTRRLETLEAAYDVKLEQLHDVKVLRPALAKLEKPERHEAIRVLVKAIADGAYENRRGAISRDKIQKMVEARIYPLFGYEARHSTDYVLIRGEGILTPVILGTRPIDGEPGTENPYGYFERKLAAVEIKPDTPPHATLIDTTVKWEQGDETYHARVTVTMKGMTGNGITPKTTTFDYKSMYADGELRGLIVPGEALGDRTLSVLDEYIDYYREEGFRFSRKSIPVESLQDFLKKEISSGSLDYLIKEAHSDGDDRNLFGTFNRGVVKVATRSGAKGRKESILIFFPDMDAASTSKVSNNDLGTWIAARDRGSRAQFVYFNTSCMATSKAIGELQAVLSPNFIDIAGDKSQETFVNAEDSAFRQLLHGFRRGLTYAEIREEMRSDPEFDDRTANVYLFPDEPEYDRLIRSRLSVPLGIDVQVTDRHGQPYNFGQRAPAPPPRRRPRN